MTIASLYKIKILLTNFRVNFLVAEGDFYDYFAKPTGWFHLVINYIGPADGQGITIYTNGVLDGSDTEKYKYSWSPGDGRVVIGRKFTDSDTAYASVEVDELTFWNRALTPQEIQAIYNMHL